MLKFSSEAKLGQIISIVTTLMVFLLSLFPLRIYRSIQQAIYDKAGLFNRNSEVGKEHLARSAGYKRDKF